MRKRRASLFTATSKATGTNCVPKEQSQKAPAAPETLIEQGLRVHRDLTAGGFYKPLTDRDLVHRWLIFGRPTEHMQDEHFARAFVYFVFDLREFNFTSPDTVTENQVKHWQGKDAAFADGISKGDPELLEIAKRWWDHEKPNRIDFRERLNRIRRAPRKAVEEMSEDLARFREDMLVIPQYRRDGPNLRLEHRYFPRTVQAGYGHVLDLLLDDERQIRSAIGKCEHEYCECLYLVSNTRKKYCSERCAQAVARDKNTKRVAAWRKRDKANKSPTRKKP